MKSSIFLKCWVIDKINRGNSASFELNQHNIILSIKHGEGSVEDCSVKSIKKGLPKQAPFGLTQYVTSKVYLLWATQFLDLPLAEFLHLFPSLVFAAHLTFLAIFSPFFITSLIFLLLAMHLMCKYGNYKNKL